MHNLGRDVKLPFLQGKGTKWEPYDLQPSWHLVAKFASSGNVPKPLPTLENHSPTDDQPVNIKPTTNDDLLPPPIPHMSKRTRNKWLKHLSWNIAIQWYRHMLGHPLVYIFCLSIVYRVHSKVVIIMG